MHGYFHCTYISKHSVQKIVNKIKTLIKMCVMFIGSYYMSINM